MPRIRTVKPEFFTSEAVAGWHPITRLVFMGLLVHAEDNGVGGANERLLASLIFPMDDRDDAIEWTRRALDECSRGGQIVLYEASGRRLYAVANWTEHQRIDRPSKTRYERPTEAQIVDSFTTANAVTCEDAPDLTLVEDSTSPRRALVPGKEGKGREGNYPPPTSSGGVQGGLALATQPPLLAEVPSPPAPPAKAKGHRLSESWRPSAEVQAWSHSEFDGRVDITTEWAKFQDYWLSRTGAGATKLDWDRTWKNWLRRAAEHAPRGRSAQPIVNPRDVRMASTIALVEKYRRLDAEAAAQPAERKAIQ